MKKVLIKKKKKNQVKTRENSKMLKRITIF